MIFYSTLCPILLGQMIFWYNRLSSWSGRVEHPSQSQPKLTQPCTFCPVHTYYLPFLLRRVARFVGRFGGAVPSADCATISRVPRGQVGWRGGACAKDKAVAPEGRKEGRKEEHLPPGKFLCAALRTKTSSPPTSCPAKISFQLEHHLPSLFQDGFISVYHRSLIT